MCSFSAKDICSIVQCVEHITEIRECSERSTALTNFISEEEKLSETISNQQVQEIEDHVDMLQVEDLLQQLPNASEAHPTQPIVLRSTLPPLDSQCAEDDGQMTTIHQHATGSAVPVILEPGSFSSRGQARTGSHHGRGGRRKGSGFQVRRNYAKYAKSVLCKRMMELYTMDDSHAFTTLVKELLSKRQIEGSLSDALATFKVRFTRFLEENVGPCPYTIQELPFCVLGVSARFSKSDSLSSDNDRIESSMSRHITNTWLDYDGGFRCTCLGSTQYSILAHNREFDIPSCEHTQAFCNVFESIGEGVFGTPFLSPALIFATSSSAVPDLVNPLTDCFPFYRYIHRRQSIVYMCKDAEIESERCWVPIRCVQRKGVKFLCAFCDSIATNACHHVKSFTKLRIEPSSSNSEIREEDDESLDVQFQNSSTTAVGLSQSGPISHLPVAPVNCEMALRTELIVCQNVREKKTYVLSAPDRCIYCDGKPLAHSEKRNASGLIMCSIGACRMEVQTLQCGNCKKRYSAEGRNEGVFLESICSAATHALLRHELIGFALANGTLNSRLTQLHSNFAALEDANVFSNIVPCLSTKTMGRMCTGFAKLAVLDPPEELFWCSACQTRSEGVTTVPKLLCIDGIWAGYLRKSKKAFHNVMFNPKEPEEARRTVRISSRASSRPKTALVRLERAVSILLLAIKGEKIEVTTASLNAAVSAVRIISSSILPEDFYRTSVCGRTANDFEFDSSLLQNLQLLTSVVFDESTLLYRLIRPMLLFFQGMAKRRKSRKGSKQPADLENLLCHSTGSQPQEIGSTTKKRKRAVDPDSCCLVLSQALQLSPLGRDETDSIPWNSSISDLMMTDDSGRKMLNLYRSLVQGPVTHFFRKDQLKSARILAETCIKDDPKVFMRNMVSKERYNVRNTFAADTSGDALEVYVHSNIAEVNRILLAGLFSAAVVDSLLAKRSVPSTGLLPSFGKVILEGISVVERFYQFYEASLDSAYGQTVSSDYAKDWSSKHHETLRHKFMEFASTTNSQHERIKNYDDVYTTGTFFPAFPQMRPLLFNDEGKRRADLDQYGFCSKHYWQLKGSFTPGAVTFCCGCAHPIVLGFKVLEWDEGPRAILDVLVSRFPYFPRYLIYDFACGVYKSAAHSLWWAVGDSTLVSDPFHGSNHKCSPSFTKTTHIPLDMSNTISHEQRNRPIAKIKNSLQQTSQDTYISLLAFQIMVNNISAKTRTADRMETPVQNRSASDLEWGYFKRLKLVCPCCCLRQDTPRTTSEALDQERTGESRT